MWRAPGRANLIGEHTDYNDGWVLPFALHRGVCAAASARGDGMLELRSRQEPGQPAALPLRALAPGSPAGWAAYAAGVAWALRETGYQAPGASVAIDADLPRGAGLASSAALGCAVALALTGLAGIVLPRTELAAVARRAENCFAGMPCGIMDQSASLLCTADHALLLDCRSGDSSQLAFNPAASGLTLLIIDTRQRHELADGDYARRRRECEQAARALGVATLREVPDTGNVAGRLADGVLRRRARHVISENDRVLRAAELMRLGQLDRIGALLSQSHASLRRDFEVSWPGADAAVDAALAAGALGARMMGGGFGGSVIALVPADRAGAVRDAVGDAYAARRWLPPAFLGEAPADGARRLG